MNKVWNIYWNEYAANAYLYGSEITFHKKNDVEFKNKLMPPGTVIKKWYSKTNFQTMKIEPALPIIDGESEYKITLDVSCSKEHNVMLRMLFFDRYENLIGTNILRKTSMDFKCPIKTYSYVIELINSGICDFHFHSIVLMEKEVFHEK